jgi:hypothetical protein
MYAPSIISTKPIVDRNTAQRHSMSDIAEDPNQQYPAYTIPSRKRADSLHSQTPTPRVRRSADVEEQPRQAIISAYIRSSYYDDDVDRPRRFSSAEHYHSPCPPHHNSQGEVRRLSGNFNAPTHIELERYRDHKRSSRSIGKLKNTVRSLLRA